MSDYFCKQHLLLRYFFILCWLVLKRHPSVSLPSSLSFFLSFSESLTTRCDCVFFIPKHPEGTEYFLPLLSPLVVVGSLSNHIKVNGPQRHTVSQHGEPVLVQSGLSGDQSCSFSIKIWWLSICSWRLFWTACVWSPAQPPRVKLVIVLDSYNASAFTQTSLCENVLLGCFV